MGQNENVFRAEIGDGAKEWAELVGQNGAEWAKWGLERGGTPGIYLWQDCVAETGVFLAASGWRKSQWRKFGELYFVANFIFRP